MTSITEAKYRITLTQAQIACIYARLTQTEPTLPITTQGFEELVAYLDITLMKISRGMTSASHIATQRKSLLDQLGEGTEENSPAAIRFRCYAKYEATPKACTPTEIQQARTFMYENNMMTPEEEAEFEEAMK